MATGRMPILLAVALVAAAASCSAWEPTIWMPTAVADAVDEAVAPLIHALRPLLGSGGQLGSRGGVPCDSWRLGVETNNVRDWKMVPANCVGYVGHYMLGKHYRRDSKVVIDEAIAYLDSLKLSGNGKEVWVFDIDETTLSNLPYYATHGFGSLTTGDALKPPPVSARTIAAGDETTWGNNTEERRARGAIGPPLWHIDREVESVQTPAYCRNCHGTYRPPFGQHSRPHFHHHELEEEEEEEKSAVDLDPTASLFGMGNERLTMNWSSSGFVAVPRPPSVVRCRSSRSTTVIGFDKNILC